MEKTPVSLLQELMAKRGTLPQYTEVSNGPQVGHLPIFTIQVECCNLTARGSGLNKKEAKHKAAMEMLHLLKSEYLPKTEPTMTISVTANNISTPEKIIPSTVSPCSSPSPNSVNGFNYIGWLQEYCVRKRLPLPIYEEISIQGPDHCRKFFIKCTALSESVEGVANTKKLARQEAAKKIYESVNGVLDSGNTTPNNSICGASNGDYQHRSTFPQDFDMEAFKDLTIHVPKQIMADTTLRVLDLYPTKTKRQIYFSKPSNISDRYIIIQNHFKNGTGNEVLIQIDEMIRTLSFSYVRESAIKSIMDSLKSLSGVSLDLNILPRAKDSKLVTVGLVLNTKPAIYETGIYETKENAIKDGLLKLLENLKVLLT